MLFRNYLLGNQELFFLIFFLFLKFQIQFVLFLFLIFFLFFFSFQHRRCSSKCHNVIFRYSFFHIHFRKIKFNRSNYIKKNQLFKCLYIYIYIRIRLLNCSTIILKWLWPRANITGKTHIQCHTQCIKQHRYDWKRCCFVVYRRLYYGVVGRTVRVSQRCCQCVHGRARHAPRN